MEEIKMINHNMPNMNCTREPTSQNHSSLSLESNNNLIMNITLACKSPNTTDNDDKDIISAFVHSSHVLVSQTITDKANEDDENGESEIRVEEITGREKLKRHREEIMGKVKIPKKWGQEKLLKEWIEITAFEALFPPHTSIITARDALIADGRKARSQGLRVHSNC